MNLLAQKLKQVHQKWKVLQIQKMNTEETEIIQQQEKENHENYTGIITFNLSLIHI